MITRIYATPAVKGLSKHRGESVAIPSYNQGIYRDYRLFDVFYKNVNVQVLYQVWRLISRLYISPLATGPIRSCAISITRKAYSPAAISAHWIYRTHCHLCPTSYSYIPESNKACEAKGHNIGNNVPILRGGIQDISLKTLHQAGFETARQASDISKAPRSDHWATSLSTELWDSVGRFWFLFLTFLT